MSRVLQYRSLIKEVICRNVRVRQEHTFKALGSKNESCCLAFHRKYSERQLLLNHGSQISWSMPSSSFHTTIISSQSEGPNAAASTEKGDEKEELSQSHEEFQDENYRDSRPSTSTDSGGTPGGGGGQREGIIDRLRRLSNTPADEYELSPIAQEKAREMAKVRSEAMKNGEQWKWDQRNIRPGNNPQQQHYGNNNRRDSGFGNYGMRRNRNQYDDEEDDGFVSERSWRSQSNFNDRRQSSFKPRRSSRYEDDFEDGPDNYEAEMQKLRERLDQNKAKKGSSSNKPQGEDWENERSNNRHVPLQDHSKTANLAAPFLATKTDLHVGNNDDHNFGESRENFASIQYSDHEVDFSLAEGDPNTFGILSFATSTIVKDKVGQEIRKEILEEEKALSVADEEEEEDDTRFIPPYGERWTTDKLIRKVRDLLEEKKLKEAVDTYLGVLKQGGFQFDPLPLRHHFHVLINECANVGYVEMAFRLYNLMKKRGYTEKVRTISSLLNACANSPWDKEKNLDRIEKLLVNMKTRGREPNLINYHALIKAYGRLGETVRAFDVVDKMIQESRLNPVTETFNMLLQACISDTKNGFRYTLITWKKMQSMRNITPDIYSYNLLLRAVRDCGIELQEVNVDGIFKISSSQQGVASLPLLPPIVTEEDSNRLLSFLIPESSAEQETQVTLDNLGEPMVINVKSFMRSLSYPTNRLAVLGGVRGILSQMVGHKVPPNLKTLTELLELSRDTDITDVLQLLKTYKIKPDLNFFNMAIRQCYVLNQYKQAKEILKLMNNVYNLVPNIMTWGVLSLGCRSWLEAKALLTEMDNIKFTPNIIVLGSLLASAIKHYDPRYVVHLLEETKRREIPVSDTFILRLDDFIKTTQKELVTHEMGKQVESKGFVIALEKNPDFGEHFAILKMRYKTWIHSVDVKVDPENPWKAEFEHFRAHKKHKPYQLEDTQYESMINASAKTGV